MDIGLASSQTNDFDQVARLTDGFGADGVIITAATPSDAVVSTAFKMCRKKGRVVLVGDVGLNLNRSDFYAKEIDFYISSSYGPGRYDSRYEEQGLDYPISYVRWTENRNMAEYLRQVAEKRVRLEPLISGRYSINEATLAYQSLNSAESKPMMVLLTYQSGDVSVNKNIQLKPKSNQSPGRIRVAVLGAGSFARSSHLPNLKLLNDRFALQAVVTRSGHSAASIAEQFGAVYASTSYQDVLNDPDIDAVIIATRHHLHGSMALSALKAGKHVLVEKPLALIPEEINALDVFINTAGNWPIPVLLTGYNRRFSPYARHMAELLKTRSGPFILNYRMNAGYLPSDHWVHGPEGGGRNLGEACHIYDLFTYLSGSEVTGIAAQAIRPGGSHYGRNDNFVATLNFADGSVATLTYTSMGSNEYPKELADLYTDGKIAIMEDFKRLETYGAINRRTFKTSIQEKGLKEELLAFADAINGGIWPIPWWQQKQTAEIGFTVEQLLS
jgi:predicted dehydrogenase